MQQVITDLMSAQVGDVITNEPLAQHTTWKIGGPADLFIVPSGKQQLISAINILKNYKIPWKAIGRGSNMLVMDTGYRGAIIKLDESSAQLEFNGSIVKVGAAYSFIKLSVMAGKQGLTGLEFAGGIPGTVGGAVYMNAGAHGSDVSRILTSAEVLLDTGELVSFSAKELQFDYRHSLLHQRKGIVTDVEFQLEFGNRQEIAEAMALHKERRLRTQPLQLPCAGSVFRNPPGTFAAKLIEEAGLKGMRIGDAEVSMLHANFIVNTGKATAKDVLTLIKKIQENIFEKNGVNLVPEVLVVGES